jgi:type IV pilus assembly protein PilB
MSVTPKRDELRLSLLKAGLVQAQDAAPGVAVSVLLAAAYGHGADEQVARLAAKAAGLSFSSLRQSLPESAKKQLDLDWAAKNGCVALGPGKGAALGDPFNLGLRSELERRLGRGLVLLVAPPAAIADQLERLRASDEDLAGLGEALGRQKGAGRQSEDRAGGPVARLIEALLRSAIERRASDIHLETHANSVQAKLRVDGVLVPAMKAIGGEHQRPLLTRLKVLAGLDVAETRLPQDGRFSHAVEGRNVDFRLSILPTEMGEDVVIRVLDRRGLGEGRALDLKGLGLPEQLRTQLRKAAREPYGMLLITGPTGSGKTTTLYAALQELDLGSEKVVTIEDPVEYQIPGVVQVPVNEKKKLTFARGLRSILRHDPDKIMVGEIRDPETAQIAVQSALTGHLVFSTVHANDAADAIGRLHNMGIELYSFVSALNVVVAQRLLRLACPHCRKAERLSTAQVRAAGWPARSRGRWVKAVGCKRCDGSGYHGRSAVAELMRMTPKLRAMVSDRRPVDELRAEARRQGMISLRQAALALAAAGLTTLQEVDRVTFAD